MHQAEDAEEQVFYGPEPDPTGNPLRRSTRKKSFLRPPSERESGEERHPEEEVRGDLRGGFRVAR